LALREAHRRLACVITPAQAHPGTEERGRSVTHGAAGLPLVEH
jgi:hypothetical protein